MIKPAIEFEAFGEELRLIYRPRDDTRWVHDKFRRGEPLVVKGTFHLKPKDLVADEADAANSADDVDAVWLDDDRLMFSVATADGEYFRFKPEVLGFETPVLLHREAQPDWKWFSAERKVSILGVVQSLGLERIVIGGPNPDAIPIPEYERLLLQFPTPHELRRYVQARVGAVVVSTPSPRLTPKHYSTPLSAGAPRRPRRTWRTRSASSTSPSTPSRSTDCAACWPTRPVLLKLSGSWR